MLTQILFWNLCLIEFALCLTKQNILLLFRLIHFGDNAENAVQTESAFTDTYEFRIVNKADLKIIHRSQITRCKHFNLSA